MKKIITIITISILTITTCISTGIAIYQSKNYVKIPRQYKCETEEKKTENNNYKQIVMINIDNEQYVESYQNKGITIYLEQQDYESAKQLENTDNMTYSYDDSKKSVLVDYGISYIQNSEGEKVNIWYKDYIKNLESTGFTCKLTK